MKRVGWCAWLAVAAVAVVGLVLAPAPAAADESATPYVSQWMVCAPFANENAAGLEAAYGPEKNPNIDFGATYDGLGGKKVGWRLGKSNDEGVFDFKTVCPDPSDNVTGYAYVTIKAPKDMPAKLSLGSDDGCKVWLNGKVIHTHPEDRALEKDADQVDIALVKGDNKLLIKVVQVGGDWSVAARVTKTTESVADVSFQVDAAKFTTPFITQWAVIGPFANNEAKGLGTVYGPETELDFAKSYDGVGGKAAWKLGKAGDNGVLDFLPLFETKENVTAYAFAIVKSAKDLACEMLLGSDDGVKVFLNGKAVHEAAEDRGLTVDQDRVKVDLKAGENKLLCKVVQVGGDYSLCVRFNKLDESVEGVSFAVPAGVK